MGIKDKVLGILFDDEEEIKNNLKNAFPNQKKVDNKSNSVSNTSPVFFDETGSRKRHLSRTEKKIDYTEQNPISENKTSSYSLTDNISPIFGPVTKKVKSKPKYSVKTKKIQDTGINKENKIVGNGFLSDVVLSPIFGPMPTKQKSKTQKTHRKTQEQFGLDINDTGGFDIDIDNTDSFDTQFDTQEIEDTTDTVELIGDTDRLEKISDHINQIKNEAATIYKPDYADDEKTFDEAEEDNIETVEEPLPEPPHNSISDLIHNFQLKEDYPSNQSELEQEYQQTQDSADNTNVEISNNEFVSSSENEDTMQVIEDLQSTDVNNTGDLSSVDDIFEDDDVDESKDLFSELFGDD